MLFFGQRDVVALEGRADLVERDVRRHRARAGREIQCQHGVTSAQPSGLLRVVNEELNDNSCANR